MKSKILIYLAIMAIIPTNNLMAQVENYSSVNTFLESKNYKSISLTKNAANHLVVQAEINGTTGKFILDTGAGITLVDETYGDFFELKIEEQDSGITATGAGGSGLKISTSLKNKIKMENFSIDEFSISLMNLSHVNEGLKQLGIEEPVMGVIGADLLKAGKAIIDYSALTLYLLN